VGPAGGAHAARGGPRTAVTRQCRSQR
jgi:hypothetical protein